MRRTRKDKREVNKRGSKRRPGTNCRTKTSSGKDITRKGGEGEREKSPHTTIRQEPKKPEMQNTGDGTQNGGRREDKEPYAKPK
jgi:hypothetical protein